MATVEHEKFQSYGASVAIEYYKIKEDKDHAKYLFPMKHTMMPPALVHCVLYSYYSQ